MSVKTSSHILIIDDEPKIRAIITDILEDEGFSISQKQGGVEALDFLKKNSVDLVLLDLKMPGMNGLEVLQKIIKRQQVPQVIIISAHGSVEKAVEAVQLGAFDFLEKPVEADRLIITIKNALNHQKLKLENIGLKKQFDSEIKLVGQSKEIIKVTKLVDRAAESDIHVLITGENGTGKDLVAKNIHQRSVRNNNLFATINCAAIPANLIESELFGHEKGSFTGAFKQHIGRFEYAHSGTLFLNEIGDMSLASQATLLQVLETGEFQRVGGNKNIRVNVRIITATNKNIYDAVQHNKFREDLFYRLNVLTILIPPLRERGDDILLLADHFLAAHCCHHGTNMKILSDKAKKQLLHHPWPGNVRELKNLTEKLVVMVNKDVIGETDVLENLIHHHDPDNSRHRTLKAARDDWERNFLISALNEHNWIIKETARALGIERTHLHRLINQLDIR